MEYQNRLFEFLDQPWQTKMFPKSRQTIESLLDLKQHLRPKDLVERCSTQTGPVGIIAIPEIDNDARKLYEVLERAKSESQFFPDSLFFNNNGVIQFCGFISDSSGLNTIRLKILKVLYGSNIRIDTSTLRMTCIDYSSAKQFNKALDGTSLLDLALGSNNSEDIYEARIKSKGPITSCEVQSQLDLFDSLMPSMLGSKVSVIYCNLQQNNYIAFNRREKNTCEMQAQQDLRIWLASKDKSCMPEHLNELNSSLVAYNWFKEKGDLDCGANYDVSWLVQEGGFVVVSLDSAKFEYDSYAKIIYQK